MLVPAIAGLALAAVAAPAGATVTATTGAVVSVAPPPSVADGAYTSDTAIRVFSEKTVTLSSTTTLAVWTWQGAQWSYESKTFQAGICFQSHLLHRDRATGTSTTALTGTVTFDGNVLFAIPTNNFSVPIIGTIRPLDLTDGLLGSPGTTYSSGIASRGSDGSAGGDSLILTSPATISLSQASPTGDAMDEVRVVTACQQPVVPETGQVVLLSAGALAVLAGAVAWRRRATA
jgi:hypothetical protein